MTLDCDSLTDRQFWMAGHVAVRGYPLILTGAAEKRIAANLVKLGWGEIENGASNERIFRLNHHGEAAFAWARIDFKDIKA